MRIEVPLLTRPGTSGRKFLFDERLPRRKSRLAAFSLFPVYPMPAYRSQIAQSLHYFARPHEEVLRTPLAGPWAWRGSELSESDYRERLTSDDVAEILAAVRHARSLDRPTGSLHRDDFPLPGLGPKIARWRRELRWGRGFQVISGVPVQRLGQEGAEVFFWCFGLHLGIPGAQNPQGDLLGHVRDTGSPSDGSVRQYRTREGIDFHCDLADVVGLLCLSNAKAGGRSRVASSVTAYGELVRRRPDLASRLYEPFVMDTKGEGGTPWVGVVPCAFARGELRTFWHIGYFQSASRISGAPPMDDRAREVIELYDSVMNEPGMAVEMDFEPGDVQLVSNHTIVHGRTAYEDHGDEVQKRHLLRLWLSLPERHSLSMRARIERSRLQVVARLAGARLGARLRGWNRGDGAR